ncbi:MAG TPA: ATP-binding protein, partial [Anaeromyxobacteraceae bacterium]|nr:ATP-binding protein [Anaeromyxobacteraceae bacterium]
MPWRVTMPEVVGGSRREVTEDGLVRRAIAEQDRQGGLGLAIVRHIVELHGGRIRAESPGRDLGATFTATLPLRDAVVAPLPDDSVGSEAAGASRPCRTADGSLRSGSPSWTTMTFGS